MELDTLIHLEQRPSEETALRVRIETTRHRFGRVGGESLTDHTRVQTEMASASETPKQNGIDRSDSEDGSVMTQLGEILPRVGWGVGSVFGVGLVGYALLFGIDRATQSPVNRLAAVDVSDQMIDSYYAPQTRRTSSEADTATVEGLYLRSLLTLRRAESSTLGLFRRYKADSLHQAAKGLQRVLQRTEPQSFLAQEAQFYLGKAFLAQRRLETARTHFKAVVEQDGRRAQEAQRMLNALNEGKREARSDQGS